MGSNTISLSVSFGFHGVIHKQICVSAVRQPEVQWRRVILQQVKDELIVHLAVGAGHIPLLVRLLCLHSKTPFTQTKTRMMMIGVMTIAELSSL